MSVVQFKQVQKRYADRLIVDDINFTVEKEQFVVIVGPSGCGKSTLLNLLAGLDTVTDGQILLNGNCINQLKPAQRDIAMVFQSYALYPHMSVFDNMAYSLTIKKLPKSVIKEKVMQAAQLLQLDDCLSRKPAALSGGQRQRVAMGRAIVRHPSVFLFDEPLSNIDSNLRTEMRYEIKRIHKQLQTTAIYVTHDQTEAMTMADQLIVMRDGKIEQQGRPTDIYYAPKTAFVASFIGHYPVNQFLVTHDGAHTPLRLPNGDPLPICTKMSSKNHQLLLTIRPEHICLTADIGDMVGRIVSIEHTGADQLVRMQVAGIAIPLLLRLPADDQITADSHAISIDWAKVTLFSEDGKHRLMHEKIIKEKSPTA